MAGRSYREIVGHVQPAEGVDFDRASVACVIHCNRLEVENPMIRVFGKGGAGYVGSQLTEDLAGFRPDAVLHFVAYANVLESVAKPQLYYDKISEVSHPISSPRLGAAYGIRIVALRYFNAAGGGSGRINRRASHGRGKEQRLRAEGVKR